MDDTIYIYDKDLNLVPIEDMITDVKRQEVAPDLYMHFFQFKGSTIWYADEHTLKMILGYINPFDYDTYFVGYVHNDLRWYYEDHPDCFRDIPYSSTKDKAFSTIDLPFCFNLRLITESAVYDILEKLAEGTL